MKTNQVIVLKDQEGNIYTLTSELINLAKVNSSQHKTLVSNLISQKKRDFDLNAFEIIGQFSREEDENIKDDYIKNMLNEGPGQGTGSGTNP
jgi:hypothetical protein